jgi:hypothetical protein
METTPPPKLARFVTAFPYPRLKRNRLKTFCNLIATDISKFTREAIENEMEARLQDMEPDRRKACELFMDGFSSTGKK